MNELRRSVYLQAMGIDAYVSRRQLPGAARTQRIAIVRQVAGSPVKTAGARLEPAAGSRQPAPPIAMPRIETPRIEAHSARPVRAPAASRPAELPTRFSLAAISCGGWLWLEELENTPVTPDQLQLVQAMAEALCSLAAGKHTHGGDRVPTRAVLTQFDWPMHTNVQLDLGEAAARASVAAFILRKLEQPDCNGIVLLGRNCEARVPLDQLGHVRMARTDSSAEMLRNPLLKKQAWQNLRSLSASR